MYISYTRIFQCEAKRSIKSDYEGPKPPIDMSAITVVLELWELQVIVTLM